MNKKDKKIYLCDNCGNEFYTWSGKCPECGEWNTLKEFVVKDFKENKSDKSLTALNLSDIEISNSARKKTGIEEFDRVLGGGIVGGSIVLLGGEPGIGKSTLLLQVCDKIEKSLYVSAEESLEQIKIRADRLKIKSDIKLISDGDLESLETLIIKDKPELLIIDSIQTVYLNSFPSTPGSVVQVRECGMFLQRLAKKRGIPVVIVGHVTKDGSLAGPRILEHLVDAVLYFEGERFHDARILRGIKNRFGATNEVGIFSIHDCGLKEIKNPSELFLSERKKAPGSVITATMEGTRPLLVEVQALVAPTRFGYPKRVSSGFDLNRLDLLIAVLSKKTKFNVNSHDVFVNVVGGLKIKEPAIDLAICAAIISSFKNKALDPRLCFFGEVGLSGEIRKVTREIIRQKECEKLGYKVMNNYENLTAFSAIIPS